jgi:hypothetical protein
MSHELRAAFRSLRARPGTSVAAIACLSLGIGVNLALFGLIDTLLFSPPVGVSHAASLVRVRVGTGGGPLAQGAGPTASYPQYEQVAGEREDLLEGLAAYGGGTGTRGSGPDARPVSMLVVTPNYFSVLGVRPHTGRFFDGGSAALEEATEVVLSHRYWRQVLGADPEVLGRPLRVNGIPLTVIGIAPPRFVGVDLGDPDVWVRVGLRQLPEFGDVELSSSGGFYWLQFVGRLRPGVTLEQAVAMTARDPADAAAPFVARPFVDRDGAATVPVSILPLRTMFFEEQRGRSPVPLWAFAVSGAVGDPCGARRRAGAAPPCRARQRSRADGPRSGGGRSGRRSSRPSLRGAAVWDRLSPCADVPRGHASAVSDRSACEPPSSLESNGGGSGRGAPGGVRSANQRDPLAAGVPRGRSGARIRAGRSSTDPAREGAAQRLSAISLPR